MPSRDSNPLVSVLICTINREDNVLSTVRSVRACQYPNCEVLVLDQSDTDATRSALESSGELETLTRYFRLPFTGKARALNFARTQAKGSLLLLTDDDCEVTPGWIRAMVDAFHSDSRIGCVYGDVCAGPYDDDQGYIPVCPILNFSVARTLGDLILSAMPNWRNFGIGASMAVRAEAVALVGGWDCCVGPGSKFGSGDDTELGARLVASGFAIAYSPDARVVHHGFRTWEGVRRDAARTGFGFGAISAKYLKFGLLYQGGYRVFGAASVAAFKRVLRRERPLGVTFPLAWLRGFHAGLAHPVSRHDRRFVFEAPLTPSAHKDRVANVVLRGKVPHKTSAPISPPR